MLHIEEKVHVCIIIFSVAKLWTLTLRLKVSGNITRVRLAVLICNRATDYFRVLMCVLGVWIPVSALDLVSINDLSWSSRAHWEQLFYTLHIIIFYAILINIVIVPIIIVCDETQASENVEGRSIWCFNINQVWLVAAYFSHLLFSCKWIFSLFHV